MTAEVESFKSYKLNGLSYYFPPSTGNAVYNLQYFDNR